MSNQLKESKQMAKPLADFVFEMAWEVCNKVGGIYTVLYSKASRMIEVYDGNYYCVGPYFQDKVQGEFEEINPPEWLQKIFDELAAKESIYCHFGKWLIKESPWAILVDFKDFWPRADEIKKKLWEDFQIDSWQTGIEFTEPVVFSTACGKLLEKICQAKNQEKIVCHFHEWLSGAGLLYLKKVKVKAGLVFTTHATTLGRTMIFNGLNFYDNLEQIDPEKEALRLGVGSKHQMEKASAQNCDVFTTVSEMTAIEAEKFLGRLPDVLLPNGLDAEKFLNFEELTLRHKFQRNRLREFLIFYFFPYYSFDLQDTLLYFISGRYEFHGKGVDIFIQALANLNQQLIKEKSNKTVVAFFWVPGDIRGVKPEILANREFFQDIKDSLDEIEEETEDKLFFALATGQEFSEKTIFSKDFLFEVRKKLLKLKKKNTLPPLCTHELGLSESQDPILRTCQELGLDNRKENRVKIIFYPSYLSGHDGLSNLNYDESVQACHLGVFPSFYEPWGYTPLETAALGVSSVATDSGGFGRFCLNLTRDKKNPGIFILERFGKTDEQASVNLFDVLWRFTQFSKKERVDNKIGARTLAAFADWKILIDNYIKAHNMAVKKL